MSKNQYNPDRVSRPSEAIDEIAWIGSKADMDEFMLSRIEQYEDWAEARIEALETENAELRAAIQGVIDELEIDLLPSGAIRFAVLDDNSLTPHDLSYAVLKRLLDLSRET
jgi:hypothetical protein